LPPRISSSRISIRANLDRPLPPGQKGIGRQPERYCCHGWNAQILSALTRASKRSPSLVYIQVLQGLKAMAKPFQVDLIAETPPFPQDHHQCLSFRGRQEGRPSLSERGQCRGRLFVTGFPGDSALGLKILQRKGLTAKPRGLIERHLSPRPRIELGRNIARQGLATAMIDVSDGLLIDTTHLLEESRKRRPDRRTGSLSRDVSKPCFILREGSLFPGPFRGEIMSSSSPRPLKCGAGSPRLLPFTGFRSPASERFSHHPRDSGSSGGMEPIILRPSWVSITLSDCP